MDLVERAEPLERLIATFDRTARSRAPAVATVTGEAGIGKTQFLNLVAETLARSSPGPPLVGYGRALGNSYEPFVEALNDVLTLAGEPRSRSRRRALLSIKASVGELLRGIPVVGGAVSAGVATYREEGLLDAALVESVNSHYLRLIDALAQELPLVLLLDDMHWADESSVDLLGYTSQRLRDAPLLLVLTYREEDIDVTEGLHPLRKTLLEMDRYVGLERIPLERLSADGLGRLVRNELGAPVGRRLLGWISKKSLGNPLFAMEYLGLLRDRRALEYLHDGVEADEDLLRELSAIPSRIESILEKRVRGLTAEERRALQVASIIGPQFSRDQVIAISDLETKETEAALRALKQRTALIRASSVPGAAQPYTFFHNLVRTHVADSLQKNDLPDFQELHARCAETIYDADSLPDVQRIATHYHLAARHDEALRACNRAARGLFNSGGPKEALRFARWAVDHADAVAPPETRVEARVFMGTLLQELRQSHVALRTLEAAHALTDRGRVGDRLTCELRIHLAKAYRMENRWEDARAALAAAARVEDVKDARLRTIIGLFSAELDLCGDQTDLDACRATLEEALGLVEDPDLTAPLLGHLGLTLLALEEVDAARRCLADGLVAARLARRPDLEYEQHLFEAHFNLALLEVDAARDSIAAMEKVADDAGLAKNDTYRYAGREAALSMRWDDSADRYSRFILNDLRLAADVPQARDWPLTHPALQVVELVDVFGEAAAVRYYERLISRFDELSEQAGLTDPGVMRYLRGLRTVVRREIRPKTYVEVVGMFEFSSAALCAFNFYMSDLVSFREQYASRKLGRS